MDTFGRNAFAAHSWNLLSKRDLHYRLIRVDNAMLVADIVLEAFDHCDDGDMVIFTNRDICLVPEASAILWAFMINRGLSICYNQRVETFSQVPLLAKDIENDVQYTGVDTFVFIKGEKSREFLEKAKQFDYQIGRATWDIAWVKMIDGVSGLAKCPYNITYHVPHDSLWQNDREISLHNLRLSSEVMDRNDLAATKEGQTFYKPVPWVY
jgi:hypothetical protein